MRRCCFLIIAALVLGILPAFAQSEFRDYAIVSVSHEFLLEEGILQINVTVKNNGTDAISDAEVIFSLISDSNRELARETISAADLPARGSVTVTGRFPLADFEAGTEQTIEITVGLDRLEPRNTPIAEDNIHTLTVTIPETPIVAAPVIFAIEGENFIVLGESYTKTDIVLALAASVGIVLLLWIITVVVRLIFRRPPRFAPWQPPYGLMPMYDQNTVEGRRWAWQQHAQNSLLLAPPTEGNIHAIKLLMGADGSSLSHWKITAMRLSQYDTYGRIARTQFIAGKKEVRRLNAVLRNRAKLNEIKLQKALRPIADLLAQQFCKQLSNKNAFLPVSFDIRWEGKHGEVKIFFELYQCAQNAWYRIDQWEPMMQVLAQKMQENFTFTIHGKATPEKMKEFRERLRDDLIWLLMESLRVEQAPNYNPQEQQPARQQFDIPDTLSGLAMPEEKPAVAG
jgi:hypothetical protein